MCADAAIQYFFPRTPVLRLEMPVNWRERLRTAIEKSGKKHSAIAADANVDPTTLSRILNARMQPTFDTVVRLARAINENVGWLLDERGFTLSAEEQKELRKVVRFLEDALLGKTSSRRERPQPNALPAGAMDIPRVYAARGARVAYEASGDSMIGVGIADRDVLFVKPTRSTREASGRVVVCRLDGSEYVKVLDLRGGRIRLLSRNDQHPPIEVAEASRFELIGIVVGRTGAVSS